MKKKILFALIGLAISGGIGAMLFAPISFALNAPAASDLQSFQDGLKGAAGDAGLNTNATAYSALGKIISFVLGLLGIIFLAITIYGGITWMTAGGNEEKTKKATELIAKAAIGLAIIIGAFLITNYVIFKALNITGN